MDTYFSQLNLKTPTLMYHFCHGDFGKSHKSGFFVIIKFSTREFLDKIFFSIDKNHIQDNESPAARD